MISSLKETIAKPELAYVKKPFSPRQVAVVLFALDAVFLTSVFLLNKILFGSAIEILNYSDLPTALIIYGLTFSLYYIFDLYKPDDHVAGLRAPGRALLANLAAFLWNVLAILFIRGEYLNSPALPWLGGYFAIMSFLTCLSRFVSVILIRQFSEKVRWLFVGDEESTKNFIQDFKQNNPTGELFILTKNAQSFASDFNKDASLHYLEWSHFINELEKPWSGIVLGMDANLDVSLLDRLMKARFRGTRVYDLTDFYEKYWLKVPIYHLKNQWFIISHGFNLLHNDLGWRVKRLFDLIMSFLLILMFSPLLLLLALLIKIDSKGPVIFKQPRVGLGEKEFLLYKFRSMYIGSEHGDKYTQKHDSRITRMGRWLRLFRLDELPQLFNVLEGNMSLIGPRAEWIKCAEVYENEIPYYHHRHLIRPGITGWAQVLYPYGMSTDDAKEKLQYDLYYIKNYSLLLDFAIVLKTIRVVLFGKGR